MNPNSIFTLTSLLATLPALAGEPVPARSQDSARNADGRFVEKAAAVVEGADTDWHGFKRLNFAVGGKSCFITQPAIAAPGKPWVWRTSFPDFHAEVDLELLRHGWAVAYIECLDLIGCDAALDLMDLFYKHLTEQRGFAGKPALEGVSRGGLHAYRYAARHPDRIACIYADTPVLDLKSWPLGWPGAKRETAEALKYYGFKDEAELRAWRGNPVDLLDPIAKAKIPLRHVISLNDRVVPPEQNTLEAQRRLQALGHTMELVTVKEGTAASNGHHFPLPELFASARFIMRHTTVLPGGREYFQLRDGLANSRAKFEREKTGRVAFLGGSITFNPGWRDAVMHHLQQRFPDTKFDFIAAGIPSLGSVPHAFRLETDVLARGPLDLLFVEAAVNDHNYDSQPNAAALALRGMEGVARHVRRVSPQTDIVELHFVHDIHFGKWKEGTSPYTVAAHERVADHYGCPSVNLSREVSERITAGQFTWAGDFRDLHPSPYGQQVYANSINRLLDAAWRATTSEMKPHPLPPPLDPASYGQGRFGDLKKARLLNGFTLDPQWQPTDGKGTRAGYVNVPALVATTPGAEFEFTVEGTGVGLMITSGPDARTIAFRIDDRPEQTVNTATAWSQSLHLPWALMLADGLPAGKHTIRVRVLDGALRVFHLLEN
jgi:sialidase-1